MSNNKSTMDTKDRNESFTDSRDNTRAEQERITSEHTDHDRITGENDPGFMFQQVTYVPAEMKDKGYYYYWALSTSGRIRELERKGYEKVTSSSGINSESDSDVVVRTASIKGVEQKIILMRCPLEKKLARDAAKKRQRDEEARAMLNLHKKDPNLFVPAGQTNKIGGITDTGQGY